MTLLRTKEHFQDNLLLEDNLKNKKLIKEHFQDNLHPGDNNLTLLKNKLKIKEHFQDNLHLEDNNWTLLNLKDNLEGVDDKDLKYKRSE